MSDAKKYVEEGQKALHKLKDALPQIANYSEYNDLFKSLQSLHELASGKKSVASAEGGKKSKSGHTGEPEPKQDEAPAQTHAKKGHE